MKLYPPYKGASKLHISQPFGVNPNSYQINGHTGVDFASQYGTFLVAPENVKIEKVITPENIDNSFSSLKRGYGVLMKSMSEPDLYYLYWHCLPVFPVKVGDYVEGGRIVAQMGNSGMSFHAGQLVPLSERVSGKLGTHLHYERAYWKNGKYEYTNVLPYIDWDLKPDDSVWQIEVLTAIKICYEKIIGLFKK